MIDSVTATRIQARLTDLKIDQSELARRVGITPAAVNQLVSGKTRNSRYLPKIAQKLGVTVDYLLGDTDDPTGFLPIDEGDENEDEDTVEIAEIDLAYGMGGTFLDVGSVQETVRKFPAHVISAITDAPPAYVFIARGLGDSMKPSILDNEYVFVDRSQRTLGLTDQVWCVAYGDVGTIKRLRPLPDGSLALMSDNPDISDIIAGEGEVHLIGRVVAALRKF